MKRRRVNLGSGRIYHAKGAREAYRNAMDLFDRTIDAAESGSCGAAYADLTIAAQDFGSFFTEFKHAVGPSRYGFSPMGAPRMRQALSEKFSKARNVFAKKCMVRG